MDCACRLIDFKDCQMAEVNWNCRRCRRGPGIKSADYNTQKEKSSHPVSSSLIVIVVAVSRLAQRFGLNLIETQKGIKSAKIIKINKKKIKKKTKRVTLVIAPYKTVKFHIACPAQLAGKCG